MAKLALRNASACQRHDAQDCGIALLCFDVHLFKHMINEAPARAAMAIRRPIAEVFEAFVDPAITSRFWFSRGSARLAHNMTVTWHWEMYGFALDVRVLALEQNRLISASWPGVNGEGTVTWRFKRLAPDRTFVEISHTPAGGEAASSLDELIDNATGFSHVLAGAKAWLEHGVQLRLVEDRHPPGIAG